MAALPLSGSDAIRRGPRPDPAVVPPMAPTPITLPGFYFLTMSFDPNWIRQAIVSREWTWEAFAHAAEPPLALETVYNVINGRRLRPETVQRVYRTLRKRQPLPVAE